MRVLYFAPIPSIGVSLPPCNAIQRDLDGVAPRVLTIIDAFEQHGVDTWDDLITDTAKIVQSYNAILLCAPPMKEEQYCTFFAALKNYKDRSDALPVIGLFINEHNDPRATMRYNILAAGADAAHALHEDPATLAHFLTRAGQAHRKNLPDYKAGPVAIDTNRMLPRVYGVSVPLTDKQQQLFLLLAQKPGKAWTREALFNALYKEDDAGIQMIDMLVMQIRKEIYKKAKALKPNTRPDFGHRAIRTDHGRGYHLVANRMEWEQALPEPVVAPTTESFATKTVGTTDFLYDEDTRRLLLGGTRKPLTQTQSALLLIAAAQPHKAVRVDASFQNKGLHAAKTLNAIFAKLPEYRGIHLSFTRIDKVPYAWLGREIPEAIRERYEARQAQIRGAWAAREEIYGRPISNTVLPFTAAAHGDRPPVSGGKADIHVLTPRPSPPATTPAAPASLRPRRAAGPR